MRPKYVAIGFTPDNDGPGDQMGWCVITWGSEKNEVIGEAKRAQKEWARHILVFRLRLNTIIYEKDVT